MGTATTQELLDEYELYKQLWDLMEEGFEWMEEDAQKRAETRKEEVEEYLFDLKEILNKRGVEV